MRSFRARAAPLGVHLVRPLPPPPRSLLQLLVSTVQKATPDDACQMRIEERTGSWRVLKVVCPCLLAHLPFPTILHAHPPLLLRKLGALLRPAILDVSPHFTSLFAV